MSAKNTISKITAQEILDCRGVPTVQAMVELDNGLRAVASVPSGTSTSRHEAYELRDEETERYQGQGTRVACANITEHIAGALKGMEAGRQADIDEEMRELDGTDNLRKFGANAVLAVSLAVARAAALAEHVPLYSYLRQLYQGHLPQLAGEAIDSRKAARSDAKYALPIPLFNIFNGGKHADTNLDFQEFMVIPLGIKASFAEQLRAGAEIFHKLKIVLLENHLDTDVGIEGGFAPNIDNSMQALDLIMAAIKAAGYEAGREIMLGMDVGASVLYDHERKVYHFGLLDHDMTPRHLTSLYHDWAVKYPFIFIEDGLYEDDWRHWRELTEEFRRFSSEQSEKLHHQQFLIAGDDIFATNSHRLQAGIDQQVGMAVLVKPNQTGTLSQALAFTALAQSHGYKIVISHRSGETNDDFIADLAVGVDADYLKAGSLARGERLAKYNRLLEIESELSQ